MEVIKGYKIRLLPTKEQEILFKKSIGVSRFIYNYCLNRQLKSDKFIPINTLRKEITRLKKEESFYWLNEVGSNVIKQSAKDLGTAFDRYFKKKANYPKFKKKKDANSFYVNYESMIKTKDGVRCEKLGSEYKFSKL